MIKTANFNPEDDPKLLCTCGHVDCDQRSVNQESLDKAQLMREDYGRAMRITSAGRCGNHPNEVTKKAPGDQGPDFAPKPKPKRPDDTAGCLPVRVLISQLQPVLAVDGFFKFVDPAAHFRRLRKSLEVEP